MRVALSRASSSFIINDIKNHCWSRDSTPHRNNTVRPPFEAGNQREFVVVLTLIQWEMKKSSWWFQSPCVAQRLPGHVSMKVLSKQIRLKLRVYLSRYSQHYVPNPQ